MLVCACRLSYRHWKELCGRVDTRRVGTKHCSSRTVVVRSSALHHCTRLYRQRLDGPWTVQVDVSAMSQIHADTKYTMEELVTVDFVTTGICSVVPRSFTPLTRAWQDKTRLSCFFLSVSAVWSKLARRQDRRWHKISKLNMFSFFAVLSCLKITRLDKTV